MLSLVEATFTLCLVYFNRLVPTSQSLQMLVLDPESGLSAVSSLTTLRSWYVFFTLMTKLLLRLTLEWLFTQENAVVTNAIIGWKSSIGRWSRVQACFSPLLILFMFGVCFTILNLKLLLCWLHRLRESTIPNLELQFSVFLISLQTDSKIYL